MTGRISPILSLYIARNYLVWFALVVGAMAAIVFFAEIIELLRRTASREVPLLEVLQMALFKVPATLQETLPFAVLVSGIACYWHLSLFHEAVVARAAGVSVWQLLLPVGLVVLLLAGLRLAAFDPLATSLLARYEAWQGTHLNYRGLMAQAGDGLWVRQSDSEGETIIHAERVSPRFQLLQRVWFVDLGAEGAFAGRIDADAAVLYQNNWHLRRAWISRPQEGTQYAPELTLPTSLSFDQIVESFADPKTISLWRLPRYIALMEEMGFSARNHRLQMQRLLASPLQMVAMLLLGAGFALRPQRFGGTAALVGVGLVTGFLVFLFGNILFNLARSLTIPVELAAWTPAIASALLGLALLLHLEDG